MGLELSGAVVEIIRAGAGIPASGRGMMAGYGFR